MASETVSQGASVLAVVTHYQTVVAACEVEPVGGVLRLLGSWDRRTAPVLRLSDIERIVPLSVGGEGFPSSVAEWAESRGYELAAAVNAPVG